ncbi:Chloride channel protein 1 [Parelaphostrongylus tenuis]|uniref:Chloride channel protein 1 n=1 Tax=Parelaphostrongylus tenuis TaxID=148309 RepID=A0AAD5QG72_PARTN|nr:Chloride channel protein 1 [Parelaphostrongylus tenuis]
MVPDVKFIWKGITFSELRKIIHANREIRAFPIVLDQESRILLGSVSRKVLNDSMEGLIGDRIRQLEAVRRTHLDPSMKSCGSSPLLSAVQGDQRDPLSFKSTNSRMMTRTTEEVTKRCFSSINELFDNQQRTKDIIDLQEEQRGIWETEQLTKMLNIHSIQIDAAPFQIAENTSLFKIHSMFSLLGLQRAYVTRLGRLVGVVSLREIRIAVENINNPSHHTTITSTLIEDTEDTNYVNTFH